MFKPIRFIKSKWRLLLKRAWGLIVNTSMVVGIGINNSEYLNAVITEFNDNVQSVHHKEFQSWANAWIAILFELQMFGLIPSLTCHVNIEKFIIFKHRVGWGGGEFGGSHDFLGEWLEWTTEHWLLMNATEPYGGSGQCFYDTSKVLRTPLPWRWIIIGP